MHLDGFRDVAQDQRFQVLDAIGEEGVLLQGDLARDLEDRGGALVQRLDQPIGRLEALVDVLLVLFGPGVAVDPGVVLGIDQHSRQGFRVQLERPSAVRMRPHQDVRRHRLDHVVQEVRRRFGIEGADLDHHLGEVLFIDAARLDQAGLVALRHQVEIVEQCLHRRVEPVAVPELQGEAFPQVAREDPGRVELLHGFEHRLDTRHRTAQGLGDRRRVAGEPARLVEHIDQMYADQPVDLVLHVEDELLQQVLAQGRLVAEGGLQVGHGVAEIQASAAAHRDLGEAARDVVGDVARVLVVPDLLVFHVEGLVRLGRQGLAGGQLHRVGTGRNVVEGLDRRLAGLVERADVVRGRCVLLAGLVALSLTVAWGVALAFVVFQHRVFRQFFLDKGGELDIRKLQQLDRLLQLRRHHQ